EGVRELATTTLGLEVVVSPGDFLDRLGAADLVLCAGGMTLAEAACLGRPVITWPHPTLEAEWRFADVFVQANAATRISGAAELGDALARLAGVEHRQAMSQAGMRLVDGHGAERVARELLFWDR